MEKKALKNYYARLAKESWIKASMLGLVVGFAALAVFAAVWWTVGLERVWLGAIIFAVAAGGAVPLFYFKRFRPTMKKVAQRVDATFGLQERVLTMNELERDNSYIAHRQRQDSMLALKSVDSKLVKIAISAAMIVSLAVSFVLGVGMTTGAALQQAGVFPKLRDVAGDLLNPPVIEQFEVNYEVEGEGLIEGDFYQIIDDGRDATPVLAVADDGWAFVEWSDGLADPYRQDLSIKQDLEVFAIFTEVEDGEGEGEEESDTPSDEPPDGETPPPPPEGTENDEDQENPNFTHTDNNMINNGEDFYGDGFDGHLGDASNSAAQQGDGNMVGGYFEGIAI